MNTEERQQFIADVAAAIRSAEPSLSDEEQRWVRLAIQSEAQSIQMRRAIIEKTLGGLLWAGLVAVGYLFVDYLKNHGFR